MTTIFRDILGTRSSIAIDYMCEGAFESPQTSEADREALRNIYQSNNLDERYALAHEHLGEHDKAAELRRWIAGAGLRKQRSVLVAQDILQDA